MPGYRTRGKTRAPTSSVTIHNLPVGLKSFAKPDMASQNRHKKLRRDIQLSTTRCNFLHRFCEAMSGFAKLLNPLAKLWIVALLVGAFHMMHVRQSVCNRAHMLVVEKFCVKFGKYCGKTIRLTKLKFGTHLYKTLLHIEFEGF